MKRPDRPAGHPLSATLSKNWETSRPHPFHYACVRHDACYSAGSRVNRSSCSTNTLRGQDASRHRRPRSRHRTRTGRPKLGASPTHPRSTAKSRLRGAAQTAGTVLNRARVCSASRHGPLGSRQVRWTFVIRRRRAVIGLS